ncbi:cysteine-rich CWC family protein [Polynucleobacter sp. MWH-Loch1C5]|uniref:cysteine-rich CWC family protein n=1 Tax=Polynucleobacter sp. MWH-Loch1C5 TaxID=2689108 RepID=UPI001C0E83A9|nr:cysteine-rich CWC family protein [Polynucleobacter sp. MWH-Loch1C5]MBU3543113.1 cysteine-rich CWC family protein [Polynucleobacter sp. MWH-Loch1C5]
MNSTPSICPICHAPVKCGAQAPDQQCWCMQYPPLPASVIQETQTCLCESCLQDRLQRAGIDWQTGKDPIPKK